MVTVLEYPNALPLLFQCQDMKRLSICIVHCRVSETSRLWQVLGGEVVVSQAEPGTSAKGDLVDRNFVSKSISSLLR